MTDTNSCDIPFFFVKKLIKLARWITMRYSIYDPEIASINRKEDGLGAL